MTNPYIPILVMGALVATDKIHADAFLTFIAGLGLPSLLGSKDEDENKGGAS